jgi:hypothetical protein
MRIALSQLIATSEPTKIGRTWAVKVARKDGVQVGPNQVITFTTKREAQEFCQGGE